MTNLEKRRFEETLAFHCAPALAGIKPADLISWGGPDEVVSLFAGRLAETGVCLRLLCQRGERSLILAYRRDRLTAQLAQPEILSQLSRDGYPVDRDLSILLDHLGKRLADPEDFPHEVGLFLGYPAADVEGFRLHGGRDCLYSGLWKVYSDVEGAKRVFFLYRRCQTALTNRMKAGGSLVRILSGGETGQAG